MARRDTKERILDAAEQLFATGGFHNTSLRAITTLAGANLAAVNYHFGSKECLIGEVIERRILPLNEQRRACLETERAAAQAENREPRAENVLRALIEPTLRILDAGPGARPFIALIGRALTEPDDTVRRSFVRLMEPLFRTVLEMLCEALPDVPESLILWRLNFTIGAMGHTLFLSGKEDFFSEDLRQRLDTDSLVHYLVSFVTAGMEAR